MGPSCVNPACPNCNRGTYLGIPNLRRNNLPFIRDLLRNNLPFIRDLLRSNLPFIRSLLRNNLPFIRSLLRNNLPFLRTYLSLATFKGDLPYETSYSGLRPFAPLTPAGPTFPAVWQMADVYFVPRGFRPGPMHPCTPKAEVLP